MMEKAIVILLACELAFLVWRDRDARSYRISLFQIYENAENNRKVLLQNADVARDEAAYWRKEVAILHEKLKEQVPATHAPNKGDANG